MQPPHGNIARSPIPLAIKLGALSVIGVLAFFVMLGSFFTVGEYERDVVTRFGKYSWTAGPGLNFKVPIIDNTTTYRTDLLSLGPSKLPGLSTYTVDNQEVHVMFTIQYRIAPENIEYIYRNVQDLRPRLFQIAEDRLKSELGKVNTSHVAEQRGKLRDSIKKVMQQAVDGLKVEIVDFQLNNIEYDQAFKNAVIASATARQTVEQREQERQQAVKVAEGVVITAKGAADAVKLRGEAEAFAIRVKGEAEGKSILAQADALRANANLVDLRKAEKWNGALPTQMIGNVMPWMNIDAAKK
jgi:regulator of protease activity HflC (stomatin/prohibitin superfamily)